MSIKNTAENYGSIAKWFHWLTAVLILGSYCAVYYRHWFTEDKTPENWMALQLHLSLGITIAVVVALRILWRTINRLPDPEPGSRLEHLAAHLGHYALYVVMVIMVVTGYIGTGVNTEYFFLLNITKFEDTPMFSALVTDRLGISFEGFEKPVDFIHKDILGAWVVWLLVVGHVLAALVHHFFRKDRTIHKMTVNK